MRKESDLYNRVAERTGVSRSRVKQLCFVASYTATDDKWTPQHLEDWCVQIVQAYKDALTGVDAQNVPVQEANALSRHMRKPHEPVN